MGKRTIGGWEAIVKLPLIKADRPPAAMVKENFLGPGEHAWSDFSVTLMLS